MNFEENRELYLGLFVEHGVPPEPRISSKLRHRAQRELGSIRTQSDLLPRASRDPSVSRERKNLSDRLVQGIERYEGWLRNIRGNPARYQDWRPRHQDWVKLVMMMAAKEGKSGFHFKMPKRKPQAERAFYLDNLLANAERIEIETGQTAKAVVRDAVKHTNSRIAEGYFDDPCDPDKNIKGWKSTALEDRLSKRKNGKLPEVPLPPSITGPMEARDHFRSLLSTGLGMSDWGEHEPWFTPDEIEDELDGRTREDLRRRPIAPFES